MYKKYFFLIITFIAFSLYAQADDESEQALRAAFEPAEGVATDEVGAKGETSPDGTSTGSVTSQEDDVIVLPSVVTYIDAPVAEQRQVFTAEDIEKQHFEDLADVIKSAGIQVLSYGTYGLEQKPSIRGFTDETVRVVVDGLCMNNPETGTFDFSAFNIDSIEKIEIVRGGFTEGVEDEGAVGGVIYITTKKQSLGHHFSFDSSVKSFGNGATSPLTADTFSQKAGYDGELSDADFLKVNAALTYAKNRYLYKSYTGSIATQENAAVKDGALTAQLTHYYGGGNSVTLGERFYAGDKNCPGAETAFNPGVQKDVTNTLSLSAFNPGIAGILNVRNNAAYTRTIRTYSDNYGDSRHTLDDAKYALSGELYGFKRIKETAGLSFEYTHLDSTNAGEHTQLSGVFKETTKLLLTDVFSVTVPLAVKFCGQNAAFVPKLGMVAKWQGIELLLDGYRMVQFPNMDDLYWEGSGYHGNPDLEPEQGWGADFTVNVKNRLVPFSVQFFTNYYKDKIAWSGGTTQNVKSAFYAGVDLAAHAAFFDGRLTLHANGEYLYNRLLDKSDSLTYGKRIMWTPDLTFSVSGTLSLAAFDATVSCDYTGKRYLSNLNISYLEPYALFNASLTFTLWKKVTPYLKLENLLNTRYQSIDGYTMPGTSATVGVRITV